MAINNIENKSTKKIPFAVVEAYKSIRTNLLFLLSENKNKSVVISSSTGGEGKSTTAVNLSIVCSQLGSKVLLIDTDLRRPTIHRKMHLPNEQGISSVLVNFCKFEDAVQHINSCLDVITAGPTPPNPSELLSSDLMNQLIENLRTQYEYIIFDTPPINVVSDALVLSPNSDGILLVARSKKTTFSQLKQTMKKIDVAGVKLLGTILNGADAKHLKNSYYYMKKSKQKRKFKFGK